ncbi:hypothetical protein [Nocardia sp. NBC_00511]|uniref:hypothetical protein n=1 Tax=Nocardia sp. NBC_00511 TaxID=2903591 RepID=UPI0030E2B376
MTSISFVGTGGRPLTLMSPSAFVRRPHRWLKELHATDEDDEVFSAATNFAYGPAGDAVKPCYGTAEATVFVSAPLAASPAEIEYVDRDQLGDGRLVRVLIDAESAVAQVSCGYMARSQWAAIVNPDTGAERPDGTVGEIWPHGDNIGSGYRNRPEESARTFGNTLTAALPRESAAEGVPPHGTWPRTSDFGGTLTRTPVTRESATAQLCR